MEFHDVKIGEFANVLSGYAFKSSEFTEDGIPIIKIKNIRVGSIDLDDVQFVDESYLDLDQKFHVRKGDLLISLTGSHLTQPNSVVGRVARYSGPHALLNQRAGKIIFEDENICDRKFLYYLLSTLEYKRKLALFASGAASQANISPSQVESLEVKLPDYDFQQKIASILSTFDDLIENNTRRIEILEEMARRIYREWFVHFRYPGHENDDPSTSSGQRLVDSGTELGEIPEGWSAIELGEVLDINKGKNITKKTTNPGNVPVVAGGLTPAYTHDTPNTKHPVITVSASGANAGYVNLYEVDVWASDCSYVDLNATSNIYYYYSLMKENQDKIFHMQHGSAQPHVYPKDLNRLLVIDPIKGLKKEFEELINPIFSQRKSLMKKNKKLKETRDLLLPKLISGRIELQGEQDYDFKKD